MNLAVQDAIAASNILAAPLREHRVTSADLDRVQKRRTFPMKIIQKMQVTVQNRLIDPLLNSNEAVKAPWMLKLFKPLPLPPAHPGADRGDRCPALSTFTPSRLSAELALQS